MELAMEEKNVYEYLSNLLAKRWLMNDPKSGKYFFELLKKSKEANVEVVRIAVHPQNLLNENGSLNSKCVQLFELSLNKTDKEFIHQYSIAFLHYTPEMFDSLYTILLSYSKSTVFTKSPKYFCEYIIKCCSKKTVYKCLELITKFDKFINSDVTESNFYDSEPLNLILAIYNVLTDSEKDKVHKERCMDMFDKMLVQPQHRTAANLAIALVEI